MNYIIPAILAFLFALLLWLIKRDKYLMVYDLTESDIFPSNLRNGKYFIIKVKNIGNKAIEDTFLKFQLSNGEIQKFSNSEPQLVENETKTQNEYVCKIPLLNPKEIIQFTITTESDNDFDKPQIKLRGKGVNGQLESTTDYNSILSSIIVPIVISIVLGLFGVTFIQKTLFKDNIGQKEIIEQLNEVKSTLKADSINTQLDILKKQSSELDSLISLREKGLPDREDEVFIIFNKSGLTDLFPSYISSVSETTYRNTGYFLFHQYLIDTKRKDRYIKALEYLGQVNGMANTSKANIFYLLYKIYTEQNDNTNAMRAIKECERVAPLLYAELIKNDKFYDINSLRKKLIISK